MKNLQMSYIWLHICISFSLEGMNALIFLLIFCTTTEGEKKGIFITDRFTTNTIAVESVLSVGDQCWSPSNAATVKSCPSGTKCSPHSGILDGTIPWRCYYTVSNERYGISLVYNVTNKYLLIDMLFFQGPSH